MPEESKESNSPEETAAETASRATESEIDRKTENVEPDSAASKDGTDEAQKKKADGKKKNIKDILKSKPTPEEAQSLDTDAVTQIMKMNPALEKEYRGVPKEKLAEMIKKMDVNELLTGLSLTGKNTSDMASYKFWNTQPVPKFNETVEEEDGPIKKINPDEVPKEPAKMAEGYEWVTMDLEDEGELSEVYQLLTDHYVEDDHSMFRFNYSAGFLNWALKSPGWRKEWHVGVRASKSRKLVAFISGVPTLLRVRKDTVAVTEINFLCIHKKLRSKRLTPILIKEITRRCYLNGIFQAIYTAGIVLPKPVASCRYFHRALNWLKLFDVGFSPMPRGQTAKKMVDRNKLPDKTATANLRPMEIKDVEAIHDLLSRFLKRYDLAPELTAEEIEHWFVHTKKPDDPERVIWAYVVEDPSTHKITDLVSFYSLESTVISNDKHKIIRAAYLYYYATETVFQNQKEYENRLRGLVKDALIIAKQFNFDVFNALTLQDNPIFLESLKFGPGDGQLHFYLYNYRAKPVKSGVDAQNLPDEKEMGGVGIVML